MTVNKNIKFYANLFYKTSNFKNKVNDILTQLGCIFAYVYNISMIVVAFTLVDVIFDYVSRVIKDSKTKKNSK